MSREGNSHFLVTAASFIFLLAAVTKKWPPVDISYASIPVMMM